MTARTDATLDLVVTRVFDAPVSALWKAWSDGEQVKRWWGPKGFTAPIAKMDFREGGRSLVCMRAPEEWGGKDYYSTWTYKRIVPMERIEYVHRFATESGDEITPAEAGVDPTIPSEVLNIVTFIPRSNNTTEMTVKEFGYTSESSLALSKQGLEQCLDKMAATFSRAEENGI